MEYEKRLSVDFGKSEIYNTGYLGEEHVQGEREREREGRAGSKESMAIN